ncbi:SPFH domain-containing protein [Methylomonas methanica]|uniref:Putative transmembrane protein n=1 Tax=Methylomonas methanica (strain DSM 25384 / MC09) TaxID=857087 RepID=G0A0Q0_METMM|nr:SPFH domain-containing protein [Methylomonas methanica]AEF99984.1 putative transmembrane protein [Methylomonas methanica MC09]
MAMMDGIKRQLRSVVEWQNPDPDVLFTQWTENGDEIKNASKLIVGPGQGCIFVYEGQVKAVIEQQCMVNLQTDNVPFWTTIKKFMQFFVSEHKVGIYFYRKTKILDQKWGTTSLIKYQDPKYQFPIGLKAYGNYSYQIEDAQAFFVNIVGSHSQVGIDEFRRIISARVIQPISDYLAECGYSYADIDANREEIARGISIKLAIVFRKLGFNISDFRIEGTDFDEDTLRRINRIADLTAEAQAAQAVGLDYAKVQQLDAMREAARNESGAAGAGMGLGAGVALGQNMAQGLTMTTPGANGTADDIAGKLAQLKKLFEAELISEAEYTAKKQELLARF